MRRSWMVGAALASIPLGLSGAWLYSANTLHKKGRAEFERKVRLVVQAKLEDGERDLTVADVLRDLEAVERERALQTRHKT